jgi:hypothetical protein
VILQMLGEIASIFGLNLLEDISIDALLFKTSFLGLGKDFDMAVHGILNYSCQL